MKAIRFHRYGGPDELVWEEAPTPEPGSDEVLIRAVAAGVNPADWKIRQGLFHERAPVTFPHIPGTEVAGVVEATGALVGRFKPGDRVMARTEAAYAEYVVAKTDVTAHAPRRLPLTAAAGLPVAGGVAWLVLFDTLRLRAGQSVLVHAASGGVGAMAVQLAKLAGARVAATTSAANRDFVKALGADEVIDYTSQDFEEVAGDLDAVFDTVGGEVQSRSWQVLRKGGVLASIVSPPDPALAAKHQAIGRFGRRELNGAVLAELGGLVDAGRLQVFVQAEYPLADAGTAHRVSQTGRVRGKLILNIGGG